MRRSNSSRAWNLLAAALGATLLLIACGNGTVVEDGALSGVQSSATSPDDERRAAERLLDPDASDAAYHAYNPVFGDFQRFAELADVVFVGDLVGLRPHVADDGPNREDPNGTVIEHDGLVFEVSERLKGNVDNEVIAAQPVLLRVSRPPLDNNRPEEEGDDKFPQEVDPQPLRAEPIEILEPGIAAVASGDKPVRYLVFAREFNFPGIGNLLVFIGNGSVAPVNADGSIEATSYPPFVHLDAAKNPYGLVS